MATPVMTDERYNSALSLYTIAEQCGSFHVGSLVFNRSTGPKLGSYSRADPLRYQMRQWVLTNVCTR